MEGVLSRFSKGASTAVALNFDVSGGVHCDPSCRLHPQSTAEQASDRCYAVRLENFRRNARAKLVRHGSLHPAQICNAALYELQMRQAMGETINWLRISSAGSVPSADDADDIYLDALRTLLRYCRGTGIHVHFPVESAAKAGFYRRQLQGLVVVRESLQSETALAETNAAVSYVAGTEIVHGAQLQRRRKESAHAAAKIRRKASGRKTIVCPATFSVNSKARCGLCTACARPDWDIVYPLH